MKKVLKTIVILTIPIFMMGLVQSLIPITDGLFLNNKAGYIIAGAIGFSHSVINILNAFRGAKCSRFGNDWTIIW